MIELIVKGKNGELRLADWQYGEEVEVLKQSRKRQFVSPFKGALEGLYWGTFDAKYYWNTGSSYTGHHIAETALRLIKTPLKDLQKISCVNDNNSVLQERMNTREKPTWANAVYIELPPKPILVAKDWLVWDYSYRFMKIKKSP